MKRLLGSLAVGILIPALLILIMLTSKILNGPAWVAMILAVFVWPLPFFVHFFPGLSSLSLGLLSFSIGALIDIAVLSLLTFRMSQALKRKPRPTLDLPPKPPAFN
jgi:hypothetical protein